MVKLLWIVTTVLVLIVATTVSAVASVERVRVTKATDDQAIITRANGESYLIEKGTGCLSLWRYEGKVVLINSPGLFLGVGSSLLIPEFDQQCRIWNSESLGAAAAPQRLGPQHQVTSDSQAGGVLLIQRALALLGYDPGPADGVLGAKTLSAFTKYRDLKGLPATEEGLAAALVSLPVDLMAKHPENLEALQLASALSSALLQGVSTVQTTGPMGGCLDGHWINSVTSNGEMVILEDGSVWQVNVLDTIRTMLWLPVSRVTICGDRMINNSNSQTARVTRVR